MTQRIQITAGEIRLLAEFTDTATALALLAALPLTASGNRWGQEIYFSVPVQQDAGPEAREEMEVGELALLASRTSILHFFWVDPRVVC